jgi:hypothetical protein
MAASNYSYFDVGGCNCPAATCSVPVTPLVTCAIPQSTLHVSVSGVVGSFAMIYQPGALGGLGCGWISTCIVFAGSLGANSFVLLMGNSSTIGGAVFELDYYRSTNCTGTNLGPDDSLMGGGITITSVTCSPLNIVLNAQGKFWTITL